MWLKSTSVDPSCRRDDKAGGSMMYAGAVGEPLITLINTDFIEVKNSVDTFAQEISAISENQRHQWFKPANTSPSERAGVMLLLQHLPYYSETRCRIRYLDHVHTCFKGGDI